VATSSAEAELYATGSGVCEGMLCAAILKELNEDPSGRVHSDSTAGISAQSRLGLGKMKHVEVGYLLVQGLLRCNRMTLEKVGTYDNINDIGTKPVDQKTWERHLVTLRLGGSSEEDETSLMQVSGERRHHTGGDLARLASAAKQCGVCLVGFAALLPRADAHPTEDEKESSANLFMKVAMLLMTLWTIFVAIATRRLVMKRPQTSDDDGQPDRHRLETPSERHDDPQREVRACPERLASGGTRDELVTRLSLALQQGS
jgi:hypothetical protein